MHFLQVGDVSLLKRPEHLGIKDYFGREGTRLYHTGVKVELQENLRAKDDIPFARALNSIRNKACTPEDIKLLSTRFESVLSEEERQGFADAVNLFTTNKRSHLYNQSWAISQQKPLVFLEAVLVPPCDQCSEMYNGVYIGKDMEVILNRNINTRLRLCNGTHLVTRHFVFRKKDSQPDFIVMESVDGKYNGLTLEKGKKLLPLFPSTERIQCNHLDCKISVKSFPIQLAISMTCHKSQSQTLDKTVIHLAEYSGAYDKKLYTALSRTRRAKDVMLVGDDKLEFFFP